MDKPKHRKALPQNSGWFPKFVRRPEGIIAAVLAGAAVLALAVWHIKPDVSKQEAFRLVLVQHHKRLDRALRKDSVLLFGASTIQGVDASQLRCPAVNFGIGGETAEGLMQRLPHYRSVHRADTIILQTGLNNLLRGDTGMLRDTLKQLISEMSRHANLLLVPYQKILRPNWNVAQQQQLDQWNETQQKICNATPRCRNLPIDAINRTPERYLETDGIHLNRAGYDVLLEAINRELRGRPCTSIKPSEVPSRTGESPTAHHTREIG